MSKPTKEEMINDSGETTGVAIGYNYDDEIVYCFPDGAESSDRPDGRPGDTRPVVTGHTYHLDGGLPDAATS